MLWLGAAPEPVDSGVGCAGWKNQAAFPGTTWSCTWKGGGSSADDSNNKFSQHIFRWIDVLDSDKTIL